LLLNRFYIRDSKLKKLAALSIILYNYIKHCKGVNTMLGICLALIDEPSEKEKFERLYYKYEEYMFNIAMSILQNEALADETVQDCFLKIAEEFDKIVFVESKKTKAMVSIMVKNKARDNLDREHYDKVEPIPKDDIFISDRFISDISSQVGYNQLVQEIKNLDDIYRDILSLNFIYEYTAKEISEMLNMPVRTVETRIYRGRKILIDKLEEIKNEYCNEK